MSFDSSRSGSRSTNSNSVQKSTKRRSFTSNSSNNNNKILKSNQKTLGNAWGSNSLSSSRSSFHRSPFSDFSRHYSLPVFIFSIFCYMVVKNRKLHNQFDAEASSSLHCGLSSGSPIFHGVSIFVDGLTIPSSQELRGYMLKHGGHFENYFSSHCVTHIICSNLSQSKMKNLRSFSSGLPVVRPSWILDSVVANKLLNWVPYQLNQLGPNQSKMSDFFAPKGSAVSEDVLTHAVCQLNPETEDNSLKGCTSKDKHLSEVGVSMEKRMETSGEGEPDDLVSENTVVTMMDEPSSGIGNCSKIEVTEGSAFLRENEGNVINELQSCPQQSSAPVSSYCFGIQNMKGPSNLTLVGPSKQHHSTLGDPNFVENYFKVLEMHLVKKTSCYIVMLSLNMWVPGSISGCQYITFNSLSYIHSFDNNSLTELWYLQSSRLHFIGTWRNRYRKRFPTSSNGFECSNSSLNNLAISQNTAILHVDMDCFFVSVVIRNHPELRDTPVAVCHSDNPKGTAEISSANYPARDYGVKAGIFVRDAKALCPHLVIFPYNFKAYEDVADQFYNILHKHCQKVQAVSCDEAFLDVTDLEGEDPELLASTIRKEIFETTGCTASAGIAGNMLMARLATRSAKPNGQCYIVPQKVNEYLCQLPIKALPGIGHVLEEKLKQRNVWTCGQLQMISKDLLQKDFGLKTGEMLWNYSRGIDNRLVGVIQESKSVGAEVNWGVRLKDFQDSQHFLLNLCKEVSLRLQGCGVQGRTFTLKIKKRRKDAKEPTKYMGCGDCENLSHSVTVPVATDDVEKLQRITKQLFGSFYLDVKDIRGIGLQVSKLESADTYKKGFERSSLKSWLASASASTEHCNVDGMNKKRIITDFEGQIIDGTSDQVCPDSNWHSAQVDNVNTSNCEAYQALGLPSLNNLDMGVIESLPPELFSELNEVYSGELLDFIAKNKGRSEDISHSDRPIPHEQVEGAIIKGEDSRFCDLFPVNMVPTEHKVTFQPATGSRVETVRTSDLDKADLLPSSLSQVDTSVLQQLPVRVRSDILELLPTHRRQEFSSNAALGPLMENPQESHSIETTENQFGSMDCILSNNLWFGNPPQWIDKFKISNILILQNIAEMYYKSGSTENLSPVLQCMISTSLQVLDASCDGWNDAVYNLCELLKQFIKLKIEVDIEEICVCFRLLRRYVCKAY
ncbi:LOW QUALITY PROTEIN: BRCT domain-containing protein/IMS domain-containing protein/IMS_C domain-containing protein [Cephalotus follicularis]|uniref:DNA repair protein REV1 n=1 Tax=Cephalotus follicularis TaxID=3775 RepID=A0A1Q3B2Y9_CEPFO|nr:LOW QUALITY PROTEIN: BRCT domain-containing protein/IMS domain-containing protein/IMS_C domain-containing protein [Cephalotus follicularis]